MTYPPHSSEPLGEGSPCRVLSIRDVIKLTSLSRATLYRMRGRSFPAPVRLTPTGSRVGWIEAEVRDWLGSRSNTAEDVND